MVQSILNPTVNFPEKKSIYKEDNDYDAPIYQYVINDVPVIIALGQANYTFIEDNILYYPIYLVVDNNANKDDSGIGVFEILDNNLPNILDSDGDIEIDKIGNPLLYQFVNQEKLSNSLDSNKNLLEPTNNDEENDNNEKNHEDVEVDEEESEDIESEDEESEDEENDDNKKFIIKENIDEKISIPEQNKKQEELEISEYKYTKNEPWVETYFKNNNYKLIDNEGGGDCLFAVIRDAFSEINKDLSVEEIRKKLSSEANQEIYKNYKELFTNYDLSIKENKDSMKKLKKINSELKDRLKNVKDKNNQLKIVEEAKKIASDFNKLKNELNLLENLKGEFNFMKNINSLEKFKEIIQTCEFWADTWAISTLERLLNIKLIIFSSEYYESDDLNNVLQCGQLNDPLLIEKNTFEPDYYILLDYTGIHYKLISYRDKTIFQFQQIPYAIKILITNKCLEKNSGPYYIIPAFKIFNENHGIQQDINLDGQIENISPNEESLFNDQDIFKFYVKSNGKPLPGKGNGEQIDSENSRQYSELNKLGEKTNWRQALSNQFTSPFNLDGKNWLSVESYYQANKFKENNPEFYNQFSLDSESAISKDVSLAKAAGSVTGKLNKEQIRPKNINIDPNFYQNRSLKTFEDGLNAKFTQNKDLKNILLATKKAKLVKYIPRKNPKDAIELMQLREKLNTFPN